MKGLHMITFLLLVVGGLNWGIFALTGWEIGHLLGGMDSLFSKIVYVLVGLSALVELFSHKKNCKMCMAKKMDKGMGGQMEAGM